MYIQEKRRLEEENKRLKKEKVNLTIGNNYFGGATQVCTPRCSKNLEFSATLAKTNTYIDNLVLNHRSRTLLNRF